MKMATTMQDLLPTPSHTINSGANAIFGISWNMTMLGKRASRTQAENVIATASANPQQRRQSETDHGLYCRRQGVLEKDVVTLRQHFPDRGGRRQQQRRDPGRSAQDLPGARHKHRKAEWQQHTAAGMPPPARLAAAKPGRGGSGFLQRGHFWRSAHVFGEFGDAFMDLRPFLRGVPGRAGNEKARARRALHQSLCWQGPMTSSIISV